MTDFVTWYNNCLRHSGIGLHAPAEVHPGRHQAGNNIGRPTTAVSHTTGADEAAAAIASQPGSGPTRRDYSSKAQGG
ncbi:hypothetical protein GA0070216_11512 [Micromonospora matsumotoense]|uniref:Integrase core domain-containing protein n=1 Tax=Micromonospora matsumotoense TaxID=121616 RepID=A0A1C5AA35_9ACTN|nr:hypothetical protein GA0070216_11512 [Micromonospora matsumotoense]